MHGKLDPEENVMADEVFKDSKGNEWSHQKTEETRKAIERLHDSMRAVRELEKKNAPDYGVGK